MGRQIIGLVIGIVVIGTLITSLRHERVSLAEA